MLRDEPKAKGERPALGHVIAPFNYIRSLFLYILLKRGQQFLPPTCMYITPTRTSRRVVLELQLHLQSITYISTRGV